jgi:hypothetical protein
MEPIAQQLKNIMKTGTADDVRQFVIAHFKELPEEAQRSFAVELLAEAMDQDRAEREALLQFKKEAIDVLEASDKLPDAR